jgi:hypothetical protein
VDAVSIPAALWRWKFVALKNRRSARCLMITWWLAGGWSELIHLAIVRAVFARGNILITLTYHRHDIVAGTTGPGFALFAANNV